jgi:hypothetical protein
MYVRIARFEGAGDNWDERIGEVRGRMASLKGSADAPPIKRGLMLVDRENGRGAAVSFCETEDDLRKVDEFMNNMSRPGGTGTRSSVEMFEVAVDSDQL